jgi:hypothetical protein
MQRLLLPAASGSLLVSLSFLVFAAPAMLSCSTTNATTNVYQFPPKDGGADDDADADAAPQGGDAADASVESGDSGDGAFDDAGARDAGPDGAAIHCRGAADCDAAAPICCAVIDQTLVGINLHANGRVVSMRDRVQHGGRFGRLWGAKAPQAVRG